MHHLILTKATCFNTVKLIVIPNMHELKIITKKGKKKKKWNLQELMCQRGTSVCHWIWPIEIEKKILWLKLKMKDMDRKLKFEFEAKTMIVLFSKSLILLNQIIGAYVYKSQPLNNRERISGSEFENRYDERRKKESYTIRRKRENEELKWMQS